MNTTIHIQDDRLGLSFDYNPSLGFAWCERTNDGWMNVIYYGAEYLHYCPLPEDGTIPSKEFLTQKADNKKAELLGIMFKLFKEVMP